MFISTRLMLGASMLTVLTAVVASGITGWQLLGRSTDVVEHSVEQQFQAIAAGRQTSISTRLDSHRDLLLSTANTRMTQEAVYALVRPFASYRYEVTAPDLQTLQEGMRQWYQDQYQPLYTQRTQERAPFEHWVEHTRYDGLLLQYNYMRNNPNAADQLANLTDPQDATIYGQQHSRYQASFREISQRYGYHDLMLVDANSLDVIYSVSKGPVFASSLRDGPFADTALGELAKRLQANPSPGRFDVSPFSRFAGNFNAHVVFFGVPVYHPDYSPDKPLGFLIAQLPAEGFTQIMTGNRRWQDIGLGETGDAYLVDDQGQLITEPRAMLTAPAAALARLDLRAVPDAAAAQIKQHQELNGRFQFASPAVENAVAGRSGLGRQRNLFGEEVLMSWEPLAIGDRTYALITEQSLAETHGAVASLRQEVLFTTGLVMLFLGALAALASWLLTRVISGPLNELTQAIVHTARERDLSARLPERRMDEIGQMSRALNQLFGTFAELVAGIRSSAEATVVASDQSGAISRECREATQRQQAGLGALDQQSASMRVSLEGISRLVTEASSQAARADQDAERGNRSVNEVSVQIQQLSEQVADSCGSMRELSQAAGDIMSVIDTIEGIAEQTNLLALNAAIEAARAGEHGRGFAVVADEVRRLSRSTQDATGQIQSMLDRLRKTVTEASAGLQREQESAALCLDAAARAENLLVTIRGQVNGITQATQHIDQALQAENQRAAAMGNALAEIHHDAERTAAAMTELASTAQDQVVMARQGRDAAAVFRTL